jgi:hypothetical protein
MEFTPELLCTMNPTYRSKELEAALRGKEHLLTYSKCQRCGMVYCENCWGDDTLRSVYEDVIDHEKCKQKTYSTRKRLGQIQNWKNVLSLLLLTGKKELDNLKVIDYGCGWGDLLHVVQCDGVEVLGYDEYAIDSHIPIHDRKMYANSLEELRAFGPVDVLFVMSVLEHVQDPQEVMDTAKSLLKRNGILILKVMDYRSGYIRKNSHRLNNDLPALSKNLNPVEHVNLYDYSSVVSTLKRHNFKLLSTGHVLRSTDFAVIPKGLKLIKCLNRIERLSTKVIKGKELMITAYATSSD